MLLAVSYTSYAISSTEKTGDIITFAQFEEGDLLSETQNLLSETHHDREIDNEYDYDSTMPPLISKEEMYVMSSGNESDDEAMSTEMLEDIRGGSQSHPIANRRESCYKRCDCIK